MTHDERLAVLEQRVKEAEADIQKIWMNIHGPPREDSLRGRIHVLETSNAAANAARAAVEAVKLVQQRRFTKGEKLVAILISLAFLVLQTISLVYLTQGHTP